MTKEPTSSVPAKRTRKTKINTKTNTYILESAVVTNQMKLVMNAALDEQTRIELEKAMLTEEYTTEIESRDHRLADLNLIINMAKRALNSEG